jgi:hypothetical protein
MRLKQSWFKGEGKNTGIICNNPIHSPWGIPKFTQYRPQEVTKVRKCYWHPLYICTVDLFIVVVVCDLYPLSELISKLLALSNEGFFHDVASYPMVRRQHETPS